MKSRDSRKIESVRYDVKLPDVCIKQTDRLAPAVYKSESGQLSGCRSSVGQSHGVGGSSPPGSLDLKIRRDADMLLVKIMIYLAVVSAVLIFFYGASGGEP